MLTTDTPLAQEKRELVKSGVVYQFSFAYDVLEAASRRITNEVRTINRVVYDITSKPPATVEWE